MFLRNANHERFGELLVDYREFYANKEVKYTKNLSNMMDVMRQQPLQKNKKATVPDRSSDKETKEGQCASSFTTTNKSD